MQQGFFSGVVVVGGGSVQRSSEMYKDFLLSFYGYVVFIKYCNQF